MWPLTYLPPRAPRKAAPKGAGVTGEVARYHGRFCFCCAYALMCGFQYNPLPSPLAIWKFSARECANHPCALRARPHPPTKCHKTADVGCRCHQIRGGVPTKIGNIFAGADLPTYLPWLGSMHVFLRAPGLFRYFYGIKNLRNLRAESTSENNASSLSSRLLTEKARERVASRFTGASLKYRGCGVANPSEWVRTGPSPRDSHRHALTMRPPRKVRPFRPFRLISLTPHTAASRYLQAERRLFRIARFAT